MTKVLLTGGSGFLAAHVLNALLSDGHSVVTTVRSQDKADKVKAGHPHIGKDKLDFAIVEDIAREGAFDQAVVSDPPFEAVIHTASPCHFDVTDVQKELLAPAIVGTTTMLKSIKAKAPTVKRCVITSSFAAIMDFTRSPDGYVYSEKDWSPVTMEQAASDARLAYVASKTFAERAAWDFADREKPHFSIATICPPVALGPVAPALASLGAVNTSNATLAGLIAGRFRAALPPMPAVLWIDVRDCATAHVRAMERPDAGGQRFFTTAGHFSHAAIAAVIAAEFPEYRAALPPKGAAWRSGELPPAGQRSECDTGRAGRILGLTYRPLKETVVDAVRSMKALQS